MFRPHVEARFVTGVITIVPLKMIEIWLSTTSLNIEIHLSSEVETLQIQSLLDMNFIFGRALQFVKLVLYLIGKPLSLT